MKHLLTPQLMYFFKNEKKKNYPQADVCHAYQVLIDHGFDPNNIITFMYDGKLFFPPPLFF